MCYLHAICLARVHIRKGREKVKVIQVEYFETTLILRSVRQCENSLLTTQLENLHTK